MSFLILFLTLGFGQVASAAMSNGPYSIQSAEYKFPASVMADVRPDMQTELWGKVFWPKNAPQATPLPLLFFLHGNHETCGTGSAPRRDNSCEYTESGTCPSGSVVTPNHEGYNYIAENLASYGYLVVSINANRGITCADGPEDDEGANLIRGRLILKHMQQWVSWNSVGGLPASLSPDPNLFKGRVAFDHVGLMGHSRGGEGVRAALNLYRDVGSPWPALIPGLNVEAIYEIGAVDGQTSRVLNAKGVAWNQVLPSCDGDVSDLEGANVYDRMMQDPTEPATAQKSLTLIYGANHNFFNTEWQTTDSTGCFHTTPIFDSTPWVNDKQANVNLELMSRFFRGHVGLQKDPTLAQVFDPLTALPTEVTSITRVDRDFVLSPSSLVNYRIDDFDQLTGLSTQHNAERVKGAVTEQNQMSVAKLKWTQASASQTFEVDLGTAAIDLSPYEALQFRVSLGSSVFLSPKFDDFSVSLIDSLGHESNHVKVSDLVKLDTNGSDARDLYQTVLIPLSAFLNVDHSLGKTIRFTFDQTSAGSVNVANLWLVKPRASFLPQVFIPHSRDEMNLISNTPSVFSPVVEIATNRSTARWSTLASKEASLHPEFAHKLTIQSEVPFLPKDALLKLVVGGKSYAGAHLEDYTNLKSVGFYFKDQDYQEVMDSKNAQASIVYGSSATSRQVWHVRL